MTWRRAWGYVAVFVALTFLQAFSSRQAARQEAGVETVPRVGVTPIPFLAAKPEDIEEVDIEMSGQSAQLKRAGTRWEVIQPAGKELSGDLVSALLTAVLEVPEVEVVGVLDDRAVDFGMDAPTAELRLKQAGRPSLDIRLGALNPARTAVYASGSGTPQVVLLGLNVRYYLDLVAEALFRGS
jgi:hypothetical protein